jgi:Bacterial protein of unknown function (DUF899)
MRSFTRRVARGPQGASRQGARPELDALRAERRQMPWVKIEKPYVLEGPEGACRLGDLFGGRSQLAIYHFMLTRARTMCAPAARSSPIMWMRRTSISSMPSCRSPRSRACRFGESRRSRTGWVGHSPAFRRGTATSTRFRRVVHARGHCRRPRDLQLRDSDPEEPRHVRRERLREGLLMRRG